MTYNTIIYTVVIFCSCMYLFRFFKFSLAISLFIALLSNFPLILSLSLTQWLDSICGNPSLLLALISLGSLLAHAKTLNLTLPICSTFMLNQRAKFFLFILGFVLFWGNINYLLGFDLFNLDFYTQILFAFGLVVAGYFIQAYLGVLLLICSIGYLLAGGNIFSYMMDILLWLYVTLSLLLGNLRAK